MRGGGGTRAPRAWLFEKGQLDGEEIPKGVRVRTRAPRPRLSSSPQKISVNGATAEGLL